jgi:acrylyl-CoA reductase (NADPH)
MPFIISGVVLAGIDSALHPMPARPSVWQRLHDAVDTDALALLTTTVGLSDVPARAAELLDHGVRGRTVVALAA